MREFPPHLPDNLVRAAIIDQPEGCSHVSWGRLEAVQVVNALAGGLVAILGGDVLIRKGEHFEHSYDNWYSQRQPSESWADFVARSHREALEYVTRFSEPSGVAVAYAFVFSASPKVLEVDLGAVNSREELHKTLASALGFPDWYGRNWDAFWDCVRDPKLSVLPKELTLRNSAHLSHFLPREYRLFKKCLDDLSTKYPERALKVTWA